MTDYEKYAAQVALVKEECKDADDKEIAEEFKTLQQAKEHCRVVQDRQEDIQNS